MDFKPILQSTLLTSVLWMGLLIIAETAFDKEMATLGILGTPFIALYAVGISSFSSLLLMKMGKYDKRLVLFSPLILGVVILPLNWI